jgi:hypothetical protein
MDLQHLAAVAVDGLDALRPDLGLRKLTAL